MLQNGASCRVYAASETYSRSVCDLVRGHGLRAEYADGRLPAGDFVFEAAAGGRNPGKVRAVFLDPPFAAGSVYEAAERGSGSVLLLTGPEDLSRYAGRAFSEAKRDGKKRLINLRKSEKSEYDNPVKISFGGARELWDCVAGSDCRWKALGHAAGENCGSCDVCLGARKDVLEGYGEAEEAVLSVVCAAPRRAFGLETLVRTLQGLKMADFIYPHFALLRGTSVGRIVEAVYRLKNAGLIVFESPSTVKAGSGAIRLLQGVT